MGEKKAPIVISTKQLIVGVIILILIGIGLSENQRANSPKYVNGDVLKTYDEGNTDKTIVILDYSNDEKSYLATHIYENKNAIFYDTYLEKKNNLEKNYYVTNLTLTENGQMIVNSSKSSWLYRYSNSGNPDTTVSYTDSKNPAVQSFWSHI